MRNAVVWSKNGCQYCTMAKDFLARRGIEIEERNVESGEWTMKELQEAVPGARAFPQIFIDGKYIGGYDKMKTQVELGDMFL